ncbi:ribose 5-phosphate isomerase B [Anaerobium acetethylicum]|uniref:Ribose 5-phosphate isomerase B n=1 Tax=Anaerobium acetethylicum TaxID=1619234 RepID=A0A1D3TX93_9FIRM|nr:ribose 5-phosphate isomerase B [Anaerobium acetethylicum]SCP98941.1 ribose 5-phosphate isomerase B [Anaerobium acetethylicum]
MNIALGCDEAAFSFKESIKQFLEGKGIIVDDYGTYSLEEEVLYPDVAIAVAQSIKNGKNERGLLFCGTGLGMAIAANKVPGIRACTCHDPFSAERSRKSNNAQIMTMGARVIGIELAKTLVDTWLKSEFAGGGSEKKVDRIMSYEKELNGNCNK